MIVNPAGHPLGAEHPGHLGDAGALSPEQLALVAGSLGELLDPSHSSDPVAGVFAAVARASSASARLRLASSIISPSSITAPSPAPASASRIARACAGLLGAGREALVQRLDLGGVKRPLSIEAELTRPRRGGAQAARRRRSAR